MVIVMAVAAQAKGGLDNTIRPGEIWPDDKGVHINAHGGGVMEYKGMASISRTIRQRLSSG